jgi:sugar phosphate isomerase/epimerase
MKIGAKISLEEPHLIQELAKDYDFLEIYFKHNIPLQLEKWPKHISWTIHIPHFNDGVNLSVDEDNKMDYAIKCLEFGKAIGAKKAIVHPGAGGSIEIMVKNIKAVSKLAKSSGMQLLLETVPVAHEFGVKHTISKPDELKEVMKKCGCGLCLDFSHAAHAAFTHKIPYKDFIMDFMKLKPDYFHLYDTKTQQELDVHLNLGEGNFDMPFLASLIKDGWALLELPRNERLQNYLKAKKYLVEKGFYP